jgi:cellobiose phosphorylase
VNYYPAEDGKKDLVITMLKRYFIYLRDEVGTGPNGLVKILNSDWSDSFFHDYSPNKYAGSGESHLNTAMVLAVFPKFIDVLKQSKNPDATLLITALEDYRNTIDKAFMQDLGDSRFAPRAYLSGKLKFGTDNVCIEPQGYVLQIPGLSNERKKEMYGYIKSKIITPEKIGARTREKPLWNGNAGGEDGGIWFSLEYPLLLGVATFDKEEAKALLLKFSFDNYAKQYPDYWVGHWTAADEVNSTLYREGLYEYWVGVPNLKEAIQGYCSHPHTWPLFCYFRLRE